MDKYSIAIMPPEQGLAYVDELKSALYAQIKWFNSRNSKAHVTISEFIADEDEIDIIIDQLKQLSSHEDSFRVNFIGVNNYKNGAVFLKPDEDSKLGLTSLMKRIQKGLRIKNIYNSKDPHISIGRKLSESNIEIALKMFADAKLNFDCDHLVLRKFNTYEKQYDIFSNDFKFLGLHSKPDPQQSLF